MILLASLNEAVIVPALVALLVSSLSGIIVVNVRNKHEKIQSRRNFLVPLYSDFLDNMVFEYKDIEIYLNRFEEWKDYFKYIKAKVRILSLIVAKIDVVMNLNDLTYIPRNWRKSRDEYKKIDMAFRDASNDDERIRAMQRTDKYIAKVRKTIIATEEYLYNNLKEYFED